MWSLLTFSRLYRLNKKTKIPLEQEFAFISCHGKLIIIKRIFREFRYRNSLYSALKWA